MINTVLRSNIHKRQKKKDKIKVNHEFESIFGDLEFILPTKQITNKHNFLCAQKLLKHCKSPVIMTKRKKKRKKKKQKK